MNRGIETREHVNIGGLYEALMDGARLLGSVKTTLIDQLIDQLLEGYIKGRRIAIKNNSNK